MHLIVQNFQSQDPGRIEVPVGMESDVAIACDPGVLLDSQRCHNSGGKRDQRDLHRISPVNLIEESIRVASTLTTSTAEPLSAGSTDYTTCSEPDLAVTSRRSSASDLDGRGVHADNHTYLDLARLLESSDSSARTSGRSSNHSQYQWDADMLLQEAIAEIRSFDSAICGNMGQITTSKNFKTSGQNNVGACTPSAPHKRDESSSRICIFRDLQPSKNLDAYLSRDKNEQRNGLRSCKSLGSLSIDLRKLISQSRNESNQSRRNGIKPTVHHQHKTLQIVEDHDTLVMIPR
jgi:hypothetical protein